MSETQPAAQMRREIFEQPAVLSKLIANATAALQPVAERAIHCSIAVLAARGSSDNASTYGKYLLEGIAGIPTALASPSLYTLYRTPPRLVNTLVIGVSQSGQSADVIEVVREARRQGAVTLAITNTNQSPLAAAAEYVLYLDAGLEQALAATKTVTAQCAVYAVLAGLLSNNEALLADLRQLGALVEHVLSLESQIAEIVHSWTEITRAAIIGRGYCYSAVQETALKLKETCFISAEPYSAADFMHGPLAMIEPGYAVLALLNPDATLATNQATLQSVHQRGGRILEFAATAPGNAPDFGGVTVSLGNMPPTISNIPFIVAGQLFAMHLSVSKGFNPDVSRGVHKVTVTI